MNRTKAFALFVVAITLTFALAPRIKAQATETILYNFETTANDANMPFAAPVFDAQGNLFGVTPAGGTLNQGAVYQLSPNGSGGWTEAVLYSFSGGADGGYPYTLTPDNQGNLFGTTFYGGVTGGETCGTLGCGTVYKLSPNSSGGWTESVVYSFKNNAGGYYPDSPLIIDSHGNLFGTGFYGGAHGEGTVFELSPGSSGYSFQLLFYFQGYSTGAFPSGALTMDAAGNLYGMTENVGGGGGNGTGPCPSGCGTVFRLAPSTSGLWTFTKLFEFFGPGGATPGNRITLDAAGNLYGGTQQGGKSTSACYLGGCGLIFKLSPTASGFWKETILHQFTGGADGFNPIGGVVVDSAGNVFGAANYGSSTQCQPFGCGTLFKAKPASGGWQFSTIYGFTPSVGIYPNAVILDASGNLIGTTAGGPLAANCIYSNGCGTVFELSNIPGSR